MNWDAIENAIAQWVGEATTLSVIWSQQEGPRPEGAFVEMALMDIQTLGQDWLQAAEVDGAGVHYVRGTRMATLRLQCFAGDAIGAGRPSARLQNVIAAARFPARHDALNASGVAIASFEPVQSLDGVVGVTDFEPRAILDIRLHLAEEVSAAGDLIEHLIIEGPNGQLISEQGPLFQPQASFTYALNPDETSGEVVFTDTSTTPQEVFSWLWDFGDGSTSEEQNPTHVYSSVAEYEVTLTVTDIYGLIHTVQQTIYVTNVQTELTSGVPVTDLATPTGEALYFFLDVPDQTLEVEFEMEGGTGDADIYVRFGAIPTTSEWDHRPYLGGNNETVTVNTPQEGRWYVMVRAFNAFAGVTLTPLITPVVIPTASFHAQVMGSGDTLEVTDTSVQGTYPITSWLWDFGDGNTFEGQTPPPHTYGPISGYSDPYTTELLVTDANGNSDTAVLRLDYQDDATELLNGVPIQSSRVSGGVGTLHYFDLPEGATNVQISCTDDSGSGFLKGKFEVTPQLFVGGADFQVSDETISINPVAGRYWVRTLSSDIFSPAFTVTIQVSWDMP